jgi:N-carbamoylputrescine amidase
MSNLKVAAIQMACTWDKAANLDKAEALVHDAAQQGAQVILLPELFETPYFCKDQKQAYFALAHPVANHPLLSRFSQIAKKLKVVLPISFFERSGNDYYNSLMMIDDDGQQLGLYRKTHIPDGPGYEEKFYFKEGNTGFKVWKTQYGVIGVGICWDQWFPEAARTMALMGAEILFYPSAIGSEPQAPDLDSSGHWQRVMQGHAAANLMPLVASNRIGQETGESCDLSFYGSSFIASPTGEIISKASRDEETVISADFDLDEIRAFRREWALFQDRRPKHYREFFMHQMGKT